MSQLPINATYIYILGHFYVETHLFIYLFIVEYKYESLLLHCDQESWRKHQDRSSAGFDSAQTTFWHHVWAVQVKEGAIANDQYYSFPIFS